MSKLENINWESIGFAWLCVVGLVIITALAIMASALAYIGVRKALGL